MKKVFALLFTVISTISLNAQVVESVEVEWPRKIEPDKNIVSKNKLGKNQIQHSARNHTAPKPIGTLGKPENADSAPHKRLQHRHNRYAKSLFPANIPTCQTQRLFHSYQLRQHTPRNII